MIHHIQNGNLIFDLLLHLQSLYRLLGQDFDGIVLLIYLMHDMVHLSKRAYILIWVVGENTFSECLLGSEIILGESRAGTR